MTREFLRAKLSLRVHGAKGTQYLAFPFGRPSSGAFFQLVSVFVVAKCTLPIAANDAKARLLKAPLRLGDD